MKIQFCKSAYKIISFFVVAASFILLPNFVLASSTDGTIDLIYKYGWSENIGWLNFGLSQGNILVTDSELSGYCWSSNYGWINLNPPEAGVKNDGNGALSGSAWGENTGWINFSGVSIDSDGYFSGYASGDVTGRISFNCSNTSSCADSDFKVQTDWRPQTARPQCNNAIDDDSDGLIDYPRDLGCDSLEDTNEVNEARVSANVSASMSESLPSQTLGVLINNGEKYTNSQDVVLTLFNNSDVENISISNTPDFQDASQMPFQREIKWKLKSPLPPFAKEGNIETVYVKFYTRYGKPSGVFSDTIILDAIAPELQIDNLKNYYTEDETIILTGKTDEEAEIILNWNQQYGLIQTDNSGYWKIDLGKMPAGNYILEITPKDLAGNKGAAKIIDLIIKPVEKEKISPEEVNAQKTEEGDIETQPETSVSKPADKMAKIAPILKKIENTANKIIEKIIGIIKPSKKDETEKAQKIVIIPKEPPLLFKSRWSLLPKKAIDRFVLAPLPTEFKKLAEKFPEIGKTFEQVGIRKITDLNKLASIKLTLPGLMERLSVPSADIKTGAFSPFKPVPSGEFKTGEFAFPKSVPLAKLSPQMKQQLPAEIVFAKTGGELIDFNIALSISEKGQPQQKISTILGKPLHLIVKPEKPVQSVRGYVVFKSKNLKTWNLEHETQKFQVANFKLQDLLSSTFFALPVLAQTAVDANYIALEGSNFSSSELNPALSLPKGSKSQETRLVLMEFEYTDPDGDGIYTAEIQAPVAEGEYEIITVMDFEDPELGSKEIRLITVVDPEGYVYESSGGKEIRIPGAIVSLYSLNPATKQYELWPAQDYQQENPQVTNNTGKYSFLVPEGFYNLKIEAPGYLNYEGKPFQVKEGSGIHENIELKTKYWWLKIVDWKTAALIVVILFLMYNFYKDRKRERELKLTRNSPPADVLEKGSQRIPPPAEGLGEGSQRIPPPAEGLGEGFKK